MKRWEAKAGTAAAGEKELRETMRKPAVQEAMVKIVSVIEVGRAMEAMESKVDAVERVGLVDQVE